MKKYAFTALTVALCTAASGVSYGAVFSDIGSNMKWAESYINSVYESGLMVGDYNSRGQRVFRGSENMTYSEAAQLIYSMVLKSGFSGDVTQMGINRYTMEMDGAKVADWAKKAVAFCMEKGIISSYDLTKFKSGDNDAKITREDMALFLGRALALNYTVSTGTSLTFNDTSAITAAAKPYVELLNKLGVVTGDNNNFNPKNNITRAEVSVMASKSYSLMKTQIVTNPESGYTQTSGVVVSLYEENGTWVLRLTTPDGVSGFVLTSATPVYNNASSNVGPTGLGLGDTVTVYSSGASIAKVAITKDVEVDPNQVNSPQFSNVVKDKGELISAGEYKIGLIDKHGDRVYYTVAKDADITLNGKQATLRQLSDRIKGDALLEVTVELNTSPQEAYKVTVVEEKYTSATEGQITNINRREISIKSGSKSYTYKIADNATAKYNGSSIAISSSSGEDLCDKFDALTGSKYIDVELTLNKDDEVTKIVAEASNYKEDDDKSYSGDIKSITLDGADSKIKVGSKSYTFDEDDVRISIIIGDDKIDEADDLKDAIKDNMTIRVELTIKDGDVTKIDGYVSSAQGNLTYVGIRDDRYPRGEMWLETDNYGQLKFNYDEDTRLDIDGTDYDAENIDSLKRYVNSEEPEVTVKFDDDGLATSVKD